MNKNQTTPSTQNILSSFIIFIFLALVVFTMSPLDLIDIDSSQYGEIAREMVTRNNYWELTDQGKKYLDKPILTFWVIASAFKIFGISNGSYRLPAMIFFFLSLYSLYRITELVYNNRQKSILAVLIYSSAPGVFAMLLDPKIDIYLVSYLIFTHHFYFLGIKKNKNYFLFMFLMMSLGFITKGPISIVIPIISIGGDIFFRRDFRIIHDMRLYFGIPILISFPLFWCYLLFQNFSFYGPHFFIWIQSFGRFYREMYDVKYDPFFFINNFIWAFSTFIIILILFIFQEIKKLKTKSGIAGSIKKMIHSFQGKKIQNSNFVISFWLFLFLFLISFSKYQLPQYIYWCLPAASIFTASIVYDKFTNSNWHLVYPILISVLLDLICIFVLSFYWIEILIISVIVKGFLIFFYFYFPKYFLPILSVSILYLFINLQIYPILTSFQPAHKMSKIIQQMEPNEKEILTYLIPSSKRSYSFYSDRISKSVYTQETLNRYFKNSNERLIIIPEKYLPLFKILIKKKYSYENIASFPSYKIATPKMNFFLKNTRDLQTETILLIKLIKNKKS